MNPAATAAQGAEGLAAFAAQEFRALLASAPRAVAAGKVSRQVAEDRLQCWLAIVALCSADEPAEPAPVAELERLLPLFRVTPVYRPGRGWRDETSTEAEARACCAHAIRPRSAWAPMLAAVLAKATAEAPAAPRTRALADLAAALGVTQPPVTQSARAAA